MEDKFKFVVRVKKEEQKKNEQKIKCLENDNKFDYCDEFTQKSSNSLSDIAEQLKKLSCR